jgi:hypothetical protein
MALTKVRRGGTDTGISDSSDATAITIDSSENVGIGTTSPTLTNGKGVVIADATAARLKLCDTTTGEGASDGFQIGHSGGLAFIFNHEDEPIQFGTNNTERVRILNTGDVAIGATSTTAKVSIVHSTTDRDTLTVTNETSTRPFGQRITLTSDPNDTTSTFLQCKGSTTTRLQVSANGNVTNTNNSYGAVSDLNLKENITDCNSQWDDIKEVKVKNFSYKADKLKEPNMIGVIAQDLEASKMNGIVEQNKDRDSGETFKSVKYSVLYMKAIKALQEAMTRIETLEAKVTALESK